MPTQTVRYLLVISTRFKEKKKLNKLINDYNEMIERVKHIRSIQTEWHLLYLNPYIPAFALLSPDMIHLQQKQWNEGVSLIKAIGKELNIPESQQHLESGAPDWQAIRIAKRIKATHVMGFSPLFKRWQILRKETKHLFFALKKDIRRVVKTLLFRRIYHRLYHH